MVRVLSNRGLDYKCFRLANPASIPPLGAHRSALQRGEEATKLFPNKDSICSFYRDCRGALEAFSNLLDPEADEATKQAISFFF